MSLQSGHIGPGDVSKKANVMSLHLRQIEMRWLKQGAIVLGLSLIASQSLARRAEMTGPFSGMAGRWSGGGVITMTNGATERIRCGATYAVPPSGAALSQSLRCASVSYRLNVSSHVVAYPGGAISGSWSEATRGVSGTVSGRATRGGFQAYVTGAGFTAGIAIGTRGRSQSVAIRPQAGTDVSYVSITMRKG
jgi:hypothetical protein